MTETAENVVAAIRGWVRRYGEAPTQSDWDPGRAASAHRWANHLYHDDPAAGEH